MGKERGNKSRKRRKKKRVTLESAMNDIFHD